MEAAVEEHRRWPQGIPAQSTCGSGTSAYGEARSGVGDVRAGPSGDVRTGGRTPARGRMREGDAGGRTLAQGGRAAHVGAPYNREETGAGRERQRRDTGRGISAEGHRRRGGRQYEWDVRFARGMPGGPQARWAPSRRDVRATFFSSQCFFGSRTRSKQQSNNISKG